MVPIADLIQSVKQKTNGDLCERSVRMIQLLPESHWEYLLYTIDYFPQPIVAFKILAGGRKLPFDHYERYIKFMANR